MPRGRDRQYGVKSSPSSSSSDHGPGGGAMRRNYRDNRNRRGGDSYGKNTPRHHDSRDEEKPCRTLFVRNLKFDTTEDELWSIFGPFGDIKEIFNRISARGMAFVHYYDLRSAESAMISSANIKINGRTVDIHYSLPKDDIRTVKCDATKNQGTLLLSLNHSSSSLVDEELYEIFQRFGDVKVIRTPNFRTYSENTARWQRLLEFFDSRAAVRAANATHGKDYKNGVWDVTYFWDQGPRNYSTPRDTSPSQRVTRLQQTDYKQPYHQGDSRKTNDASSSNSLAPPLVPYNNLTTNAPPDSNELDNTQKAQKLISLLTQLHDIQSTQTHSSMYPSLPLTQQTQEQDKIQQLIGLLTQTGSRGNHQPAGQAQLQTQQQPVYNPYVQAHYQQQAIQPQYQIPQQEPQQQYQQPNQESQPLYQQPHQEPQPQYQQPQQSYVQYPTYSYPPNPHPPYNP